MLLSIGGVPMDWHGPSWRMVRTAQDALHQDDEQGVIERKKVGGLGRPLLLRNTGRAWLFLTLQILQLVLHAVPFLGIGQ